MLWICRTVFEAGQVAHLIKEAGGSPEVRPQAERREGRVCFPARWLVRAPDLAQGKERRVRDAMRRLSLSGEE